MQLGATPSVASTWMFLTKIGVPIRTTAYFMNQPIVRDYLKQLESFEKTIGSDDDEIDLNFVTELNGLLNKLQEDLGTPLVT